MKVFCKYYKQKQQVSYNQGQTWKDVTPEEYQKGDIYEYDSNICTFDPFSEYSGQPFTFEAIDDCTFGIKISDDEEYFSWADISYSLDSGSTWHMLTSYNEPISVASGNKIYWKNFNGNFSPGWHAGTFVTTGNFNAEGNIMSLPWGDDFTDYRYRYTLKRKSGDAYLYYKFGYLLKGCTGLISAKNMLLPATEIKTASEYPQNDLQRLYVGMFSGCTSLVYPPVLLPLKMAPVWGYKEMFKDCCSLIEAPEIKATVAYESAFESMFENCLSLSKPMKSLFAREGSGGHIDNIYKSMFKFCINLETAPDLLMDRLRGGQDMFYGCHSLKSIKSCVIEYIDIGNWLYDVYQSGTFETGANLGVDIPSNWLIIESQGCRNLKFAAKYGTLVYKFFKECDGNTVLTDDETIVSSSTIKKAYVGDCVTEIGEEAFYSQLSLTSIRLPNSIEKIDRAAFHSCYKLTGITIPNTCKIIGNSAFYRCEILPKLTIPSSVTSIGSSAFRKCGTLMSITVERENVPALLGDHAFDDTNNCPIYVPANSVDAYKAASGWSTYASRIQAIP